MKRAILAAAVTILLVALAATALWACTSDPEGRMYPNGGEPYCGGGGHGCAECVSYDQGGDWLTCIHSMGQTICYGQIGGRPYSI